ncbi:hypothetical protein VTK73DRAFT_7959 [Phialemonium thermophilum]|uniref:Uncharacterized protein n=1 Tax=Phialemonium thermophilum TaxID=223376 RepID=A0ABR3WBN5_9PEZI
MADSATSTAARDQNRRRLTTDGPSLKHTRWSEILSCPARWRSGGDQGCSTVFGCRWCGQSLRSGCSAHEGWVSCPFSVEFCTVPRPIFFSFPCSCCDHLATSATSLQHFLISSRHCSAFPFLAFAFFPSSLLSSLWPPCLWATPPQKSTNKS